MDRNTIIGTVLISLILIVWFTFLAPPPPEPPPPGAIPDSTQVDPEPFVAEAPTIPTNPLLGDSTIAGGLDGEERILTVENDLYEAVFSTRGATLLSFQLKEYKQFDQVTPIQIVDTTRAGALSLAFTTPANHNVDTRAFLFDVNASADRIVVDENDEPVALTFTTTVGQGLIRMTYTFSPGTYEVGLRVEQQNATSFSTREGYELVWHGGVPFSEGNHTQEAMKTAAYARSGGEVEYIVLQGDPYEEQSLRGQVDWVAVKNQYFTAAIMPQGETRGAELIGERIGESDSPDQIKNFEARLLMPLAESDAYTLFLGPLEYYRISRYDLGLYDMVDYGWDFFEWMTRPVAKFVLIPMFNVLDDFIPSYGIIIIILAFFIKLVVSPLTRSSYRSMAQMRELQPEIQAIREKYADNPQKQQEATMKLYKESGVNPLGGCLPMFLQYPILIALWQFLPQSIEIRQEGFLWAQDLSAPDVIFNLPFTIPLYGDFVAGFCLLMGISMVIQMRFQTNPAAGGTQAKVMMYMMPIVLFVVFNQWASGLNLYYLFFNILTAIQQRFINKSIEQENEKKAADAGKGPASRGKSNGQARNSRPGKGARNTSRKAKP